MNFQFHLNNTKLNKKLILSKVTEEQIMYFYLKIPLDKKKLFCSPFRIDKSVTCSIFKSNNGTILFKDFATGETFNCFEVVKKLYNCNYYEALKIIANDFNIVKDNALLKHKGKLISKDLKIEDKETSKIQVEIQDFTDLELKWWSKFGITPEILKKYNVYSCKHVFLNDNLVAKSQQNCPIFGYYGGTIKKDKEKLELWRCYFPKRDNYRFITNWPTKKIQGYNQLPKKGKLLVITKSMKDTMVLDSLNISSCSPNSETQFISDTVLQDLKQRFKYIVVLFDSDYTGISFMNKLKKKYPELLYTWIPRKYEAKDISDFYKDHGRKETLNLIKQFVLWLKSLRN